MRRTYHSGTDAAVSGDVRSCLNTRPCIREIGLLETLLDSVEAGGVADVVVDGACDAVLRVAVTRSHVQNVFRKRPVLDAVVGAGAVAAEAVARAKHVGG